MASITISEPHVVVTDCTQGSTKRTDTWNYGVPSMSAAPGHGSLKVEIETDRPKLVDGVPVGTDTRDATNREAGYPGAVNATPGATEFGTRKLNHTVVNEGTVDSEYVVADYKLAPAYFDTDDLHCSDGEIYNVDGENAPPAHLVPGEINEESERTYVSIETACTKDFTHDLETKARTHRRLS